MSTPIIYVSPNFIRSHLILDLQRQPKVVKIVISDIAVLIPSLEPEDNFIIFLEKLAMNFSKIIIVNDGSSKEYDYVFNKLKDHGAHVLQHNVNLGKGRALKSGMNYILNNFHDIRGIVTADSDGQHSIEDIQRVASKITFEKDELILGTRNFNQKQVPLKSSFGNKLTQKVFSLFCGLNISDTQTGLRAFNVKIARHLLSISGERFEYETNALIESKRKGFHIIEVPITTIYLNNNKGTHFNPLLDSFLIYKLFAGYFAISLLSFIIDITLFQLFYVTAFCNYANGIVFSTLVARILSSLFNYFCNKNIVFKSSNALSLLKYYILVILQMFVSGYSVKGFFMIFNSGLLIIKIIVDMVLFIINFYIQREWVFRK